MIIAAYLLIAVAVYIWFAGLLFAYFQGEYAIIAESSRRSHSEFSLIFAVFIAVLWPLHVPLYWFLAGRGKFGWKWPSLRVSPNANAG